MPLDSASYRARDGSPYNRAVSLSNYELSFISGYKIMPPLSFFLSFSLSLSLSFFLAYFLSRLSTFVSRITAISVSLLLLFFFCS